MNKYVRCWLVIAFTAIAMMPASKAVVEGLYHGFHTQTDILFGIAVFMVLVVCTAFLFGLLRSFNNALLKAAVISNLLLTFYLLMRPHLGEVEAPLWAKASCVVVALGLLLLGMFRFVGDEGWIKAAKAITVSCAIFGFSPIVLAWTGMGMGTQKYVNFANVGNSSNMVVLILDETSPEYASGFLGILNKAGLTVHYKEVNAAGKNTLNAIPAMLSLMEHDDVAPCSSTTLCGTKQFSFRELTAVGGKTDVVGFYHPYCAIQGLRSCNREENVFAESSSTHFTWTLICGQVNIGGLISFCNRSFRDHSSAERTKRRMLRLVDDAPFWRKGGVLFVHIPIPHPSMTPDMPSLKVEYEGNISVAEEFVSNLVKRLGTNFGEDYAILITSDHPLRRDMWCATKDYASPTCIDDLPRDRGKVPLIFASFEKNTMQLPTSNRSLLIRNF